MKRESDPGEEENLPPGGTDTGPRGDSEEESAEEESAE